MNVIVSNRQKEIIDNANIDAIKDLNGLFNVSDLINKFKNYFFSKMILDATSVVNFASKEVLTTLANEIGAEKLIVLLPATPEPPMEFKKLLIELGIFNFTNNIDDVIKFIERPNTYEDAVKTLDASYNDDNGIYVDNSIKEETSEENISNDHVEAEANININNLNNINTIDTSNNENTDINQDTNVSSSMPKASLGDILNNFSFQNANTVETVNQQENVSEPVQEEIRTELNAFYNEEPKEEVKEEPSVTGNTFLINDDFDNTVNSSNETKRNIIGFKNVTSHAGSTSLIYMLHKMATVNLKKDVLSIELRKNDFRLFRDAKMISINEDALQDTINNAHEELIFVDLNDYENDNICDDIIYLVEPSTIKLNELMAKDKTIFKSLNNKKVLLNKSLLSSNDVHTLESEAGIKFISNISPLNDRIFNDAINELLRLLDIK